MKKEITTFGKRLDKHEDVILSMTDKLSMVVGEVSMMARIFYGESGRKVRKTDE